MYLLSSNISAILAGRQRIEHARQERVRLERHHIQLFCERVVLAAMRRIASEFERHGRRVEITRNGNILVMIVLRDGKMEFNFSAVASRRHSSRRRPGRHRDRFGYAHIVDRVYSLKDARNLGADHVCREIVDRYQKQLSA